MSKNDNEFTVESRSPSSTSFELEEDTDHDDLFKSIYKDHEKDWPELADDSDPELKTYIRGKVEVPNDKVATRKSVFDDPGMAVHYWPLDTWENKRNFDPRFRWTVGEEKSIIRKTDLKIMIWAMFMFFALQLDRGNISQANSDSFLEDLKITTNDFNNGQTIFYCSFLFAELPSQLISKRIGPDRWIPIQMTAWSIIALLQCLLTNRAGFFVTRALLGLSEGGFIPDLILFLSYFYKGSELPRRLSYFWSAYLATFIISAFMAYGILHLDGHHGLKGWRWIFLIEGLVTLVIGLSSFILMVPGPSQTHGGFLNLRRGGYFTAREQKIIVNRVIRDDPKKCSMHNRQALTPKMMWISLKDVYMWPLYLIGLSCFIPMSPPQTYFTLQLKALGFSTLHTNLLTIPAYVIAIVFLLFLTFTSERLHNKRFISGAICQAYYIPLFVTLLTYLRHHYQAHWVGWIVSSLLVGAPYHHAVQVGWCSRNSNSVSQRTVSASVYNMCVQTGSIIASQIYRTEDKPLYVKGNSALLAIAIWNILVYLGSGTFYYTINQRRNKKWNSMLKEEQYEYLKTTSDEGSRRLDFRFAF